MAGVTVLLVIAVASFVPAIIASDYTVGDSSGWANGVDYGTWASDKTFKVGDTLLFAYGFLHTVSEVTKSDYDSCSSSSAIQSYNDQNTKFTLDKPGTRYFICGTPSHCSSGMKLAVTTLAASSSGTPSTGTTPPSTTPTESSPNSPSTPTESSPNSSSTPTTPSEGTPKKNTPGVNAANGGGFSSALMVGVSLVGLALVG